MMNNLITYLTHLYGKDIALYFTDVVKIALKDDSWDNEQRQIVCATNLFIEEEGEEDEVGFVEAKVFIENQK